MLLFGKLNCLSFSGSEKCKSRLGRAVARRHNDP